MDRADVVNLLLGALVVAEAVRLGSRPHDHRRGRSPDDADV